MKFTFEDISTNLAVSSTKTVVPYFETYNFILKATITATSGTITHSESFNLISNNPCIDTNLNWINIPAEILSDTVYKLNSGEKVINISTLFTI